MNTPIKSPQRVLPVFTHLKEIYILWHDKFYKFPKTSRFSIGIRIDSLFIDAMQEVALGSFTQDLEKQKHIKQALSLTDTLKIFLQIAWELKLMETKHYAEISEKMDAIGKMLGGWYGQASKQKPRERPLTLPFTGN